MRSKTRLVLSFILIAATCSLGAEKERKWQAGTLLEMEKQQVLQGSTTTTNRDGQVKDKGNKTDYSQNSTSTTTDNYDNFQVYTIKADNLTYIAREKLLFPWSKPANINVGEKIKFAVEKSTMYILDDDGKQHKAGISKARANEAQ